MRDVLSKQATKSEKRKAKSEKRKAESGKRKAEIGKRKRTSALLVIGSRLLGAERGKRKAEIPEGIGEAAIGDQRSAVGGQRLVRKSALSRVIHG